MMLDGRRLQRGVRQFVLLGLVSYLWFEVKVWKLMMRSSDLGGEPGHGTLEAFVSSVPRGQIYKAVRYRI